MQRTFKSIGLGTLLFLVLFVSSCAEGDKSDNGGNTLQPADLLPASGEISGWTKGTGSGDYGEAEDPTSLELLINGGSVIYIQYGFVQGVLQVYKGTVGGIPANTELFIADMGSTANAEALFADEEIVQSNLLAWDAGDEAAINENLPFQVAIFVRMDRFFVRINVDKNDDLVTAKSTAQTFALTVLNDIQ